MNLKTSSAPNTPERVPGVFFRWEIPEEQIFVDMHLNVIELLERDAMRARGRSAGGLLLGKVNRARGLTMVIEHYEPLTSERGVLGSPFANRERMEEMVSRWRPGHSRLSLIGLYRTCSSQSNFVTNDDLAALAADFRVRPESAIGKKLEGSSFAEEAEEDLAENPGDPERVFLLIDPLLGGATCKAVLHLARGGSVVWQSPETPFNRNELSRRRAASQSPAAEGRSPSSAPQQRAGQQQEAPQAEEAAPTAPKADSKKLQIIKWSVAAVGIAAFLTIGFLRFRSNFQINSPLATAPSAAAPTDERLGLKLDQTGTTWRLSWNPDSLAVANATKGHLLVTDGGIHKDIELDASDLRGGTIIYTPLTQDVVLKLEVEDNDSSGPVSESVRTVGGMLSSPMPTQSADAASQLGDQQNAQPSADLNPDAGVQSGIPDLSPAVTPAASMPSRVASTQLPPQTQPVITKSVESTATIVHPAPPMIVTPQVRIIKPQPSRPIYFPKNGPQPSHAASQTAPNPTVTSRQQQTVTAPAKLPPLQITVPVQTAVAHPSLQPETRSVTEASSANSKATKSVASSRQPAPIETVRKAKPVLVAETLVPMTPKIVHHTPVAEAAELLSKVEPNYPESARKAGVSGAVEVTFTIDKDGAVRDVAVTKGPSLLASAAIEAVQGWRYKPASLDGVPVATQGNAVLTFQMN